MGQPIIHFAHANSFPAKTYKKLFALLSADFRIGYLERHAHDPAFPIGDEWNGLKLELANQIDQCYQVPVWGIGHSLGGILHFMLACERPELYKGIVLLDAPLPSPGRGRALHLAKKLGIADALTPSRTARGRRNYWASEDEAYRHFAAKPLFQRFDPDVLMDYVSEATEEHGEGRRLFFDPKTEAEIYRSIPHSLHRYKGKLKIPAAYIGGEDSREARLAGLGYMIRNFPIDFYFINGTHLFPFEYPSETAAAINAAIKKMKS